MMKRFALSALLGASAVLTSTLLFSVDASAQDQVWLNDRRYREGIGYRVGDFELHPGIGADFGYNSNYLHRSSNEEPVQSLRLRVAPHFSVTTLGPQRTDGAPPPDFGFRAELGGVYNEFIPVSGSDDDKDRLQEQRNIGGDLNLQLDILPKREWSGRVHGAIGRTARPTNDADRTVSYNRLIPKAGAELAWAPGSGLLDWRLGYNFSGTFFESSEFENINSVRNYVTTHGRWRFLPRTALMYDARLGFLTYPVGGGTTDKTASHPLRARLGLNGLITPSFAVLALVGWGASFYSGDDQDFDSVIGQLELKWYLSPNPQADPMKTSGAVSALSLGFVRDFDDSYIGTYLERDRGFAKLAYLFGGSFLLVAEAGAAAVVFPVQTRTDFGQPNGWTDLRVDGRLFGEYRLKDWLGLDAQIGYTGYFSSTTLVFDSTLSADGQDELAYQDLSVFLGARWFM